MLSIFKTNSSRRESIIMKFRSVLQSMKILSCFSLLIILTISLSTETKAQLPDILGLDDVSIFLDPGHSQTENQGLYGYSEAEKVLRIPRMSFIAANVCNQQKGSLSNVRKHVRRSC